ncbi:MAG: hypothetical protein AAF205_05255, partial [Pseudomonadota bacterium]
LHPAAAASYSPLPPLRPIHLKRDRVVYDHVAEKSYVPGDHYSFLAGLFAAEDVIGWTMKEEIFVDDQPAYYGFVGDQPRLTAAEVKEKYGVG